MLQNRMLLRQNLKLIGHCCRSYNDQLLYTDRLYQVPAYGGQITLNKGPDGLIRVTLYRNIY